MKELPQPRAAVKAPRRVAPPVRPPSGFGRLLQRRLAVGSAADPLEREADRAADRVFAGAAPAGLTSPSVLRRTCARCGAPETSGRCSGCERKIGLRRRLAIGAADDPAEREADRAADRALAGRSPPDIDASPVRLHRHGPSDGDRAAEAPASVHRVLAQSGQPLDAPLRRDMESRFGRDFSRVRLHFGSEAGQSARDVGASAYTVGSDIAFAPGRYAPGSGPGQRLLAHELAHVVQQAPGSGQAGPLVQRAEGLGESPTGGLATKPTPAANLPSPPAPPCGGSSTDCHEPDPERKVSAVDPPCWKLNVKVDIEKPSARQAVFHVGHAFVEFEDPSGVFFTYGFYPDKIDGPPLPLFRPKVKGCIAHPDASHAKAVDYTETFDLNEKEYYDALGFAKKWCDEPQKYDIHVNNCTTFAHKVAKVANRSLPCIYGPVGPVGDIYFDNPNKLYDELMRRDVGPTYALKTGPDLRAAISNATAAELDKMPTAEKIRVVGRLLKGRVTDDDIAAVETLWAATGADKAELQKAIASLEDTLVPKHQRKKLHIALYGVEGSGN
jgi:hypothetical protein